MQKLHKLSCGNDTDRPTLCERRLTERTDIDDLLGLLITEHVQAKVEDQQNTTRPSCGVVIFFCDFRASILS